jgi:hypothetical protein
LAGKPDPATLVERRGIEVGIGGIARQRPTLDLMRLRIDAHDRILAAVGDPGCAVGPDDHAVRRRARTQHDLLELARLRIEDAELAGRLRRVVDRAAGDRCCSDVVRVRSPRHVEKDRYESRGVRERAGRCGRCNKQDADAPCNVHRRLRGRHKLRARPPAINAAALRAGSAQV